MNIKTILYHFIINPNKRRKLRACGNDVSIEPGVNMNWNNVEIGNDVSVGTDCLFMCSGAPIHIGNHVMFGPRVTVITGDHRIDIPGKYMTEIKGTDKLPENDLPVTFEGDNWIGANSTILKGVTIGKGAVVAAGALVTKNVEPFSIVGGVPARKIKDRFNSEELMKHLEIMKERGE